ncbi:unnamed protein product [Leuciscus chuanchicus]
MFWTARVPRDYGLSGLAPALHYVNIEYLNSQTPHNGARLPVKARSAARPQSASSQTRARVRFRTVQWAVLLRPASDAPWLIIEPIQDGVNGSGHLKRL